MKNLLLLIMLFISSTTYAKDINPQSIINISKTNEQEISLNIKLPFNSKIYYKEPGDIGHPTKINFSDLYNIKNIQINWPTPSIIKEENFTYKAYFNNIEFPISFTRNTYRDTEFLVNLEYAICHKTCEFINKQIQVKINSNGKLNYYFIENKPSQKDLNDSSFLEQLTKKLNNKFLAILVIAFLGGVILNFMPCVLPIVTLKFYSIAKINQKTLNEIRVNLLSIILGIIFSFFVVSLISISLKFFGKSIGIGFYFQNSNFLIFLIITLIIYSLILLGSFKISIPDFLNKIPFNNNIQTKEILNNFFTGFLITLFSLPCSAPFVGVAISFSLSANYLQIILIFLTMGIGLSSLYILLFLSPSFVKLLPKPGNWLKTFEKIIAVLFFLIALWLMYILSNQIGIIPVISLFLLCILLKFIIEEKVILNKIKLIKVLIILAIIFLAFFLPNLKYKIIEEKKQNIDKIWVEFNPEKITNLVNQGNIVIIDITAKWCGTCQFNKALTFNNEAIIKELTKQNVIAMRSEVTKEIPINILNYIRSFDRYGVPLNVIYGPYAPNGILLSEIVYPQDFWKAYKKAQTNN